MSSAQTEVRSALAAYVDGVVPLPEFEESVARLLAVRRSARGVVHSELKAAVADGTLPPESLRRLGLIDNYAAPQADVDEVGPRVSENRPRARQAARSREGNPKREEIPRAARSRAQKAAPAAPPDTGSDWIENQRAAAPQIPECGALLGNRYRLERVIGEGGMGVVFLAVDQEVRGELFAIKVLRPEIRANPESLRLLREEVRRTRALRHPHIVGVYSLNSDPSGVYMLMEYLEGKSLKTLLDEEFGRGMPLIRAYPLIYDIGAALAYAHDHNVVHSDIKPSNIIITSSGSCKLLDFGIARADRNRTTGRDATVIGALTPAYASCEMFEGRAPDQSDDVYAFACVIYEMLTGKHPFGRINAMDARARKLQPPPIKALTNRQNQALARALEFDRARRTASVEILLEGLKGMVNNQRDRRVWLTSAAAVAAIGAVSTGWFLEHRAAHRDTVADVPPTAARAPAMTPAPASGSSPAAPTTSKSERAKEGPRSEPSAAGSATVKNKPPVPVSTASTGEAAPAAAPAVNKSGAPQLALGKPIPAPVAVQPSVSATPSASTPLPVTGSATPPAPSKPTSGSGASASATGNAALLAQSRPIPAPAAQTPAAQTPAAGAATPPPAAAGSTRPPVGNKTTSATAAAGGQPASGSATPPATGKPIPTPAVAAQPATAVTAPAPDAVPPPAAGSAAPPQSTVAGKSPAATLALATAGVAATHAAPPVPATDQTPLPPATPALKGEAEHPPFGKHVPAIVATADSMAQMTSEDNCPYPPQARAEVQTGTAVLLVYVSPDGSTANAVLDANSSTGSPVLDQAAIKCVREWGRFPAKLVGGKPVGYWARTKFVWSFGGF